MHQQAQPEYSAIVILRDAFAGEIEIAEAPQRLGVATERGEPVVIRGIAIGDRNPFAVLMHLPEHAMGFRRAAPCSRFETDVRFLEVLLNELSFIREES